MLYKVSGTGGWKEISIVDTRTGEIVADKKFRKANLDEISNDPEWVEAIDIITAAAMEKKLGSIEGVDIDAESYEEVQALAQELEMDLDVDV